MHSLKILQQQLNYHFNHQNLLQEALTHPSCSFGTTQPNHHYQRLEFLGDSILNLIVSEMLFKKFPEKREGTLTQIRNHLIKGETLVKIAKKINLTNHILIGEKEPTQLRTTKSVLEDCMEAIFGAIYLDGGIDGARNTILKIYGDEDLQLNLSDTSHPKSALQEKILPNPQFPKPIQYVVLQKEGPDHAKYYTVELQIYGKKVVTGNGNSKKAAENDAAQRYLNILIS